MFNMNTAYMELSFLDGTMLFIGPPVSIVSLMFTILALLFSKILL